MPAGRPWLPSELVNILLWLRARAGAGLKGREAAAQDGSLEEGGRARLRSAKARPCASTRDAPLRGCESCPRRGRGRLCATVRPVPSRPGAPFPCPPPHARAITRRGDGAHSRLDKESWPFMPRHVACRGMSMKVKACHTARKMITLNDYGDGAPSLGVIVSEGGGWGWEPTPPATEIMAGSVDFLARRAR
jgi:hypothetical protein